MQEIQALAHVIDLFHLFRHWVTLQTEFHYTFEADYINENFLNIRIIYNILTYDVMDFWT